MIWTTNTNMNKAKGMEKLMKKVMIVFITLLTLLFVSAALAETNGDWTYTVSNGEATIDAYGGSDAIVSVPASLGGYPVKAIGTRAFRNKSSITSVTIPSGVTSIGSASFQGCSALVNVNIPDTVDSILGSAFAGTAIEQVIIPANATNIAGNAFPSTVVLLINEYDSIALASVDGIYDYIEYEAVSGGVKLYTYSSSADAITVPETIDSQPIVEIDTDTNQHLVFPNGNKLIADMTGTVAELLSGNGYVIYDPSDLTMGLRKSGGMVYLSEYDGTASSVTIPSCVNIVGSYAFNGNKTVSSIAIPATVSSFEYCAFDGATALTDIYLPNTYTSIDTSVFSYNITYWCGLNSNTAKALGAVGYSFIDPSAPDYQLRWDDGATLCLTGYLGNGTTVTIPEGVHAIGMNVFKNNATIANAILPSTLKTIHAGAFLNASGITTIELPIGLKTIESLAFYGTGITNIDIPSGLTTIRGGTAPSNLNSEYYEDGYGYPSLPDNCFPHTTLTSIACHTLSDAGYTVYTLSDNIYGCRYIDNYLYLIQYNGQEDVITVPEGIEGVAYVFGVYNQMTSVVFPSTLKVIGYEAFKDCSGLTSITIPSTVIEIGYEAFAGSALRSIRLPDNVRTVGYGAFKDCTNLASATFVVSGQNGLNSIGESAFQNTGLRSVTIPATTESIGSYAFAGSSKLGTINFPASGSLTTIGSYAFQGTAISAMTIPGTVTTVGQHSFAECSNLTTVTAAEGVQTIGYGAFSNDYQLQTVTLNNGVKTIGDYAFYNCSSLNSINIPSGVTRIGEWAFCYTYSLSSITLPNTVTYVGPYAFYNGGLNNGITLSTGMTKIYEYTFASSQLNAITIPNSITTIDSCAFEYCYRLVDIILSNKLTSIGTGAFSGCSSLTWVELPSTMIRLNQIFQGCSSAIVVLPDSITYIHGIAFDDVRAVLGSRNNELLKSLNRFGYSDERTFVYTYIDDDGLEDYNVLRVVDYIGETTEATLPDAVSVINEMAFCNCRQLKKLTLPDTGITSIGINAFHPDIEVVCTAGSATYQLLKAGDYPVEIDGYPGLYAVAKQDGKLYDASYHGMATQITLPDNITSTFCRGTHWVHTGDGGEYNGYQEEGYYVTSNAFPDTTRYIVSSFSSDTARTLGSNGYYVTVSGKEDFGFRLNGYTDGTTGGEEKRLSMYSGDDVWFLAWYYGTNQTISMPDDVSYFYLNDIQGDTVFTINPNQAIYDIVDETNRDLLIDGYTDYRFGFARYDVANSWDSSFFGWYLKSYTGTASEITLDDTFPSSNLLRGISFNNTKVYSTLYSSISYQFNNQDFYLRDYPDFAFRYEGTDGYAISRYTGNANQVLFDSSFPINRIQKDAIPSNVKIVCVGFPSIAYSLTDHEFYIQNYPDLEWKYDTNSYCFVVYSFKGNEKQITLGTDILCESNIDFSNFPADVKIFIDRNDLNCACSNWHNYFRDQNYYQIGELDFACRYENGEYVYRYTGTSNEVVIDNVLGMRFDENAIPNNVKPYISINTPIWPHETADPGMFVNRSFYIVGYPDIEMRTSGDMTWEGIYRYTGSAKEIYLGDDFYAAGIHPNAIPNDVKVYCSLTSMATCAFTDRVYYAPDNQEFEYMTEYVDIYTMSGTPVLYAYTGTDTEITLPAGTGAIKADAIPSTVKKIHVDNMLPDESVSRILGNFLLYASMDSPLVRNGGLSFWDEDASGYPGVECYIGLIDPKYPGVVYTVEDGICLAGVVGNSVKLPGFFTQLSSELQREYEDWMNSARGYYDDYGMWIDDNSPFNPFGTIFVYPNTDTANLLNNYGIPYNVRETIKSTLPSALTTIEEEAFMNSDFEEVTIGSKCTSIGANAFADSVELAIVHIPRSVRNIDETAFSNCPQVMIYCKSGSVAETYAMNHGIPYMNE